LIEISGEYSIRSDVIQTLTRLRGIAEVNETDELNTAISAGFKGKLVVPHLHGRANDPFGFAVGLRPMDTGKLLADAVLQAGFDKGMLARALILLAIVGVSVIDLIRTLSNDGFGEKAGGAVLGFMMFFFPNHYQQLNPIAPTAL
jgi:hypothetical protein